jgi:hypothetical protein
MSEFKKKTLVPGKRQERKQKQKLRKAMGAIQAEPSLPDLSGYKALVAKVDRKKRELKTTEGEKKDPEKGTSIILGRDTPESETWADVTEAEEQATLMASLLKQMYKADRPYRARLAYVAIQATSTAGLLPSNLASYQVSTINNATDWSTFTSLFDEFYVHSMRYTFIPFNKGGYGVEQTTQPSQGTFATTAAISYVMACGLVVVAGFGATAAYSTSAGMCDNPNRKLVNSGDKWSYIWRNNVKFDPRGVSLGPLTNLGWQGWCLVADYANYGGFLQFRTLNEQVIGSGTHAVNLGTFELEWDVSFRVRA